MSASTWAPIGDVAANVVDRLRAKYAGGGVGSSPDTLRCATFDADKPNVTTELRRSGVAKRHRGRRFDAAVTMVGGNFAEALELAAGRLVRTPANANAIDWLAAWDGKHGSVYLEGPVGTGKTQLASSLAESFVEAQAAWEWRQLEDTAHLVGCDMTAAAMLGRDGGYVRHQPPGVWLVTESGLVEQQMAWYGTDKTAREPQRRAATVGLFILDELATEGGAKQHRLNVLEHVIGERYDEGRPTVYTSNVALGDLARVLNPRIASRVEEMVGGRRFFLGGPNWRAL